MKLHFFILTTNGCSGSPHHCCFMNTQLSPTKFWVFNVTIGYITTKSCSSCLSGGTWNNDTIESWYSLAICAISTTPCLKWKYEALGDLHNSFSGTYVLSFKVSRFYEKLLKNIFISFGIQFWIFCLDISCSLCELHQTKNS